MKAKIAEIFDLLTWRVEHESGKRDLEIGSDPWTRTHTIKIPTEGADWRDIEYLHELAHATLAERHHLLSTGWFARSVDQASCSPLTNPIRIASDWFADYLLMQWCPDEEAAEIREHAGYAMNYQGHDMDMIFGGGLFLSQAVHYLGNKLHTVPRRYRPVADILISVDPGKPSVQSKCNLINQLATLTCRQRVHLTQEDDMDVWLVKK
ncbi:MAG: hypothetical protein WCJ37_12665 [Syntrophus sp. (in: bacteria)]